MTAGTSLLPPDTAVGRVALRVDDLDRLVDFYTSVVGLAVLARTDDQATLGAGGRPLLELVRGPDAHPRSREEAGLFHTAFRVPDRAALGAALSRVETSWQLTGASDHRVSEALYLWDPEDNGIEIYRDFPREEWPTADGRVGMDTLPLERDALRAESSGDDALPDGADVGHVHLEVTDLDAARAFYEDTLGLGVRAEWTGAAFLAAGDYHHHVGLNVWSGRTAPAAGRGLDWFELVVPADALAAVRDRVAEAGIAVTETAEGILVRDPDRLAVRISVGE
ncbi:MULTISPECIES: VOC family protein [Salinibaculum]|uniref:VOC family protein n=1 Tax=Salinibaculum TaxID=2732368 RepID=UPI0030D4157D